MTNSIYCFCDSKLGSNYRHSARPTEEDNSGFSSEFLLLSIRISALLYKEALGTAFTAVRIVHKFKGSLSIADGFKNVMK
jgi:hypothetical protein